MKKRTRVILITGLSLFVLLWAGKFIHNLSTGSPVILGGLINQNDWNRPEPNAMIQQQSMDESYAPSPVSRSKNNYASSKMVVPQATVSQVIEQKYERVASLRALTKDFDQDLKTIRSKVDEFKAVVQEEQSVGLKGSRSVSLRIGVVPEQFEAAVEAFKAIGDLQAVEVTKTDRTGDFQALEAKRISLEKTRDGLKALRNPLAKLSDLMELETRILDIEGQIQELGVSLGDFDETQSLCTIHLTLAERAPATQGPDIFGALLDSLVWAAWTWTGLAAVCLFLALGVLILGVLIEKLLVWRKIIDKAINKEAETGSDTSPDNPDSRANGKS